MIKSENDLLLVGKSDRSSNRINDVSYNFISDNDKSSNYITKNFAGENKSNISSIDINESHKDLFKAKLADDEDSSLIFQQMFTMLNAYNESIK